MLGEESGGRFQMGCWCGEEGVWTRVVKLVTEEGKEGVMTVGFCPGHRWLFALPEIRSRSWVGVYSMRTGFADPWRPPHEAPGSSARTAGPFPRKAP